MEKTISYIISKDELLTPSHLGDRTMSNFGNMFQLGLGRGNLGGMVENLKFRPPRVGKNVVVKVFPLGSLSPLLTVMEELGWIAWYSHINILKIDTWSFFLLSLLCYKENPLGNVNFSRKIQEA